MSLFIRVIVNIPGIKDTYDYKVPLDIREKVKPGCLVEVPFGHQRVQGLILSVLDHTDVHEPREVVQLLDENPVLFPYQMESGGEISRYFHTGLDAVFSLMLPAGLKKKSDIRFRLSHKTEQPENLTEFQQKLIKKLKTRDEDGMRGRQLDAAFPHQNWRPSADVLVRKGLLIRDSVLPPPSVRPKFIKTAQLICDPEKIPPVEDLGRGDAGKRRYEILRFLVRAPWHVQVSWIYAASGGKLSDLYVLAEKGLVALGETEYWRDPIRDMIPEKPKPVDLTKDQQAVLATLMTSVRERRLEKPFLLHGVTGSGKTEIYLQLAQEMLNRGQQICMLVPEIALTVQTVKRFMGRFPGKVGLIHSRMSEGERYDTWRRIRNGDLPIVIGPRSALFAPMPNPGFIIIDEFHDDSYVQDDLQPFYNAVKAAEILSKTAQCGLLLGSATPSVDVYFRAERLKWPLLKLPDRIMANKEEISSQLARFGRSLPASIQAADTLPLPEVSIVDMREEIKAGNRSIFSKLLLEKVQETLEYNQQAILYLNRRGSATFVFCRDCGSGIKCPNCGVPLTYYQSAGKNQLVCNTCGYQRQVPKTCPECGSRKIKHFGIGTERVAAELQEQFPDARILQWDAGTATQKDAHEILLSHFQNHRADILVGTQMLAKGFDLPLVTLVGVVLAEVGLNFPDYHAAEKTFQLLMQVAGRAGRSPLGGQVIFQTFKPEHEVIQRAARQDFLSYYHEQIAFRRETGYPPFSRFVKLEIRHEIESTARQRAEELKRQLNHWIANSEYPSTSMIGPLPCYFRRIRRQYRYQIILKGMNPLEIIRDKKLNDWRIVVDPRSLL